jgi:hypothetical protein
MESRSFAFFGSMSFSFAQIPEGGCCHIGLVTVVLGYYEAFSDEEKDLLALTYTETDTCQLISTFVTHD